MTAAMVRKAIASASTRALRLAGAAACAMLSGCAADMSRAVDDGAALVQANKDPLEFINRPVFYVDAALDTAVVSPVSWAFKTVIPAEVRVGVHNALENLKAPYVAANDILQARPCAAADTATRFVVNSTLGVAGIFDVAARMNVPGHDNDLAATFAAYGAEPGPYVVLPLLGPSDVRGAVAQAAEFVLEPTDLIIAHYVSNTAVWARFAADTIDERSREDASEVDAITSAADPYAAMREAYWHSQSAAQKIPPCQSLAGIGNIP